MYSRICIFVFLFILIGIDMLVYAENNEASEPIPKILVNEKPLALDVNPTNVNGRLLVPLRAIFEALDLKVEWDDNTKTVHAKSVSGVTIDLQMNNKIAKVNGKDLALDVPAGLIHGRTLIPLRFVAESIGATVTWDDANKIASINASKEMIAPASGNHIFHANNVALAAYVKKMKEDLSSQWYRYKIFLPNVLLLLLLILIYILWKIKTKMNNDYEGV